MNGSCATTFISNAWARFATSWPIRPRPTRPRVFDRISAPANFDFSHLPAFIDASAAGTVRASDSIRPMASSATLRLLAPGAFMTTMPRAVAAGTSTLSTPVPARAMTRSFGAASINSRVTFVALRTISASASLRSAASSAADASLLVDRWSSPAVRRRSIAEAGRPSAITIFMNVAYSIIRRFC